MRKRNQTPAGSRVFGWRAVRRGLLAGTPCGLASVRLRGSECASRRCPRATRGRALSGPTTQKGHRTRCPVPLQAAVRRAQLIFVSTDSDLPLLSSQLSVMVSPSLAPVTLNAR